MIGKLRGVIDSYGEDWVIVDVGGVGYQVHCSARTLQALPAVGEAATLSIETYVREDMIRLYGFASDLEREWFRLLMTVQGVGARVALAVLGTLKPGDLATAIALQDKAALARAPGVGKKVAERIVGGAARQGAGLFQRRPGGGAPAGRPRRASRAAAGRRRRLGARQSRLCPGAGERRGRRRVARGRRGRHRRAAHPPRAQGAGAMTARARADGRLG